MNAFTQSITLSGRYATLEPLSKDHYDGLVEATRDGELWKLWYTSVPSPEGMGAEIERRLGLQLNCRPRKSAATEPLSVIGPRKPATSRAFAFCEPAETY
jgi:hypothetical protein